MAFSLPVCSFFIYFSNDVIYLPPFFIPIGRQIALPPKGLILLLVQQGLHTLGVVFLVPLSLGQFTLFSLTVIDEGLDGGDQREDAEAEPDGE